MTQVRNIAEVRCDPVGARSYEHGWQSWSPTSAYSLTASPARPSQERWRTLCYRPGVTPPDDRFQGEGLLALVPGDGTVRIWATPHPDRSVPSIQARVDGDRVIVGAGSEVDEFTFDHDDLPRALAEWADFRRPARQRDPVHALLSERATYLSY